MSENNLFYYRDLKSGIICMKYEKINKSSTSARFTSRKYFFQYKQVRFIYFANIILTSQYHMRSNNLYANNDLEFEK